MKRARTGKSGATITQHPLTSLISAVQGGRLVAMLKGEGLSGSAAKELLTPESAAMLRAVLLERPFSAGPDRAPATKGQSGRSRSEDSKVLVFRARDTLGGENK